MSIVVFIFDGTALVTTQRIPQTPLNDNQGHVTGMGDALQASDSVACQQKQLVLLQTGQQGSSSQEGIPTGATHEYFSVQARVDKEQLSGNQGKRLLLGKEHYTHGHPQNVAQKVLTICLL